jgi:hypothetical protein
MANETWVYRETVEISRVGVVTGPRAPGAAGAAPPRPRPRGAPRLSGGTRGRERHPSRADPAAEELDGGRIATSTGREVHPNRRSSRHVVALGGRGGLRTELRHADRRRRLARIGEEQRDR